jgi:uncharacterized protein with GYD domain
MRQDSYDGPLAACAHAPPAKETIMSVYFYRGEYSDELKEHVLKNAAQFEKIMRASIEVFGGKLDKCYLTAAGSDPIGFVEFADDIDARAWNTYYGSQKGVRNSRIRRLLDMDDIAAIAKRIGKNRSKAEAHRK